MPAPRGSWSPPCAAATARAVRLEAAAGHGSRAEKLLRDGWTKAPHPMLGETLEALWSRLTPAVRFTQGAAPAQGRYRAAGDARAARRPGAGGRAAGGRAQARGAACGRRRAGARLPADGEHRAGRRRRRRGEEPGWRGRGWRPGDPAWFCRACNAGTPDWSGACPHCGVFDSLEWRPPAPPAPGQAAAIAAIEQELATEDAALVAGPSQTEAAREA